MEDKRIKTEKEYRSICAAMDLLIDKGTQMGDMGLLSETDKNLHIEADMLLDFA